MGLFKVIKNNNIEYLIWDLEEDIEELSKLLSFPEISKQLESYRTLKRKKEFLCARILLKELFSKQVDIEYDYFGKPYIKGSQWNISITHSGRFVAVARSLNKIGIDIEQITEKLERTKHKFSSQKELNNINPKQNLFQLALYWSAKESVYKLIANEALIFDTEMIIKAFIPQNKGTFFLELDSKKNKKTLNIEYQKINDYVFTFCTAE